MSLESIFRKRLRSSWQGAIIFVHGGSAKERTAFVAKAFHPLEGFPHNPLRLDTKQIEITRPFAVLHKAMFGGTRLIGEDLALQDL